MLQFLRGLLRQPRWVVAWVAWLMVANMFAPLAFLSRSEAKVVLVTFGAGAILMALITARTGFTRLLGAGHFLWFPLLVWLAVRLAGAPADTPFGIWIRVLMATNGVSLLIDVVDVSRWLRGERDETVQVA